MTLPPHLSVAAFALSGIATGIAAAVVYAMPDAGTITAYSLLIGVISTFILGILNVWLQYSGRKASQDEHRQNLGVISDVKQAVLSKVDKVQEVVAKVDKQTDGMLTALTKVKDDQAMQLSETAQKLAHVEGHEEGRQAGVASEIDREPPETK